MWSNIQQTSISRTVNRCNCFPIMLKDELYDMVNSTSAWHNLCINMLF